MIAGCMCCTGRDYHDTLRAGYMDLRPKMDHRVESWGDAFHVMNFHVEEAGFSHGIKSTLNTDSSFQGYSWFEFSADYESKPPSKPHHCPPCWWKPAYSSGPMPLPPNLAEQVTLLAVLMCARVHVHLLSIHSWSNVVQIIKRSFPAAPRPESVGMGTIIELNAGPYSAVSAIAVKAGYQCWSFCDPHVLDMSAAAAGNQETNYPLGHPHKHGFPEIVTFQQDMLETYKVGEGLNTVNEKSGDSSIGSIAGKSTSNVIDLSADDLTLEKLIAHQKETAMEDKCLSEKQVERTFRALVREDLMGELEAEEIMHAVAMYHLGKQDKSKAGAVDEPPDAD